jgi:hypothetical protein
VSHRIARLEDRLQIGVNKDGTCRYCTGREKELGGRYVVLWDEPPPAPWHGQRRPPDDPTPTPCPRCGRDMNTYIQIVHEDLIAKRRAEGGWLDAARDRDRGRLGG